MTEQVLLHSGTCAGVRQGGSRLTAPDRSCGFTQAQEAADHVGVKSARRAEVNRHVNRETDGATQHGQLMLEAVVQLRALDLHIA